MCFTHGFSISATKPPTFCDLSLNGIFFFSTEISRCSGKEYALFKLYRNSLPSILFSKPKVMESIPSGHVFSLVSEIKSSSFCVFPFFSLSFFFFFFLSFPVISKITLPCSFVIIKLPSVLLYFYLNLVFRIHTHLYSHSNTYPFFFFFFFFFFFCFCSSSLPLRKDYDALQNSRPRRWWCGKGKASITRPNMFIPSSPPFYQRRRH